MSNNILKLYVKVKKIRTIGYEILYSLYKEMRLSDFAFRETSKAFLAI